MNIKMKLGSRHAGVKRPYLWQPADSGFDAVKFDSCNLKDFQCRHMYSIFNT
jgi:hypothetical protein